MKVCDSWCDHVECNKIRKNCLHLIEHRQFHDWKVENNKLIVYGKCLDCFLYVPLTIRRSHSFELLVKYQNTSTQESQS